MSDGVVIHPATDADLPAILALMATSLGEGTLARSEAVWRWKHVENRFGRSPVLVATDGDQIVGLRAFMRWTWRAGDRDVPAVRAVDTATHPEYQGRGIFQTADAAVAGRSGGGRFCCLCVQHAQQQEQAGLPEDGVARGRPVPGGDSAEAAGADA